MLTDEGRAAKERLGAIVEGIRSRVAGAVTPDDFATTLASLEAIARELGWDENARMPRAGFGRGFRPGFGFDPGFRPGWGFGPGSGFGPRHFGGEHGHGRRATAASAPRATAPTRATRTTGTARTRRTEVTTAPDTASTVVTAAASAPAGRRSVPTSAASTLASLAVGPPDRRAAPPTWLETATIGHQLTTYMLRDRARLRTVSQHTRS